MNSSTVSHISKFFVAGINYKKSDAALRGRFAVSEDQYGRILDLAPSLGVSELFVLSTCNRTEIYGFAEEPALLVGLLCGPDAARRESFLEMAYVKGGGAALEHLFQVAAGLDSQILGDYEIVGQIRQAVKFSKERGRIGSTLERMTNAVLQSSKAIKNQTELSGGTVSVSFAAVQYIREKVPAFSGKRILLLGVGKIGRNTCKNLVDYLGTTAITLINRSPEKAAGLAGELGLRAAGIEALPEELALADIILVATNSPEPTILARDLEGRGEKLIIDLSIPYNVEDRAQHLPNVQMVNVDELSRLKDETLHRREEEIPQALAIISGHLREFTQWCDQRRHVPVLRAIKTKLQQMQSCRLFKNYSTQQPFATFDTAGSDARIQNVVNMMAVKMRQQDQGGCHYIEAINEYMARVAN
jgi:glutamyl-tRNA reductase